MMAGELMERLAESEAKALRRTTAPRAQRRAGERRGGGREAATRDPGEQREAAKGA
jgi:hypothetical protein